MTNKKGLNLERVRKQFAELDGPINQEYLAPKKYIGEHIIKGLGLTGLHALDASNKLANEIEKIKDKSEEYRKSSFIDGLTDCYSQNYFKKFEKDKFNPERDHNLLGMVFIDLDNLKKTNDEYGHAAGDELIISAAKLLKSVFRRQDDVIRLGGDEFVVLCRNREYDSKFEDKLNKKMEDVRAIAPVNFSYGVVVYNKYEDMGLDGVKNRADFAMYEDKAKKGVRGIKISEINNYSATDSGIDT